MKLLFATLLSLLPVAAVAQGYQPPVHRLDPPIMNGADTQANADMGIDLERDRGAGWSLAEHRRLSTALAGVKPQKKGVVEAFVVVAALDSDPVFGREAREAMRVLERRYGAAGHSILLAGTDGTGDSALPMGSPANLSVALARVAEVMDPAEDVLVLYTTSHGAPFGIYYHDGDQGYGAVSPTRLWSQLSHLGIRNRLILVSACYSGVFVPMLSSDSTAIVTAASAERSSFGCQADNDWTYFGDALVNRALRRALPLASSADEARRTIAAWEAKDRLTPSEPQVAIGAGAAAGWLRVLEQRLPAATPPVGRPATATVLKK